MLPCSSADRAFALKEGPTPQSSDALSCPPSAQIWVTSETFPLHLPRVLSPEALGLHVTSSVELITPCGIERREGVTLFKGEKPQAHTGAPSQPVARACSSVWNRRRLAQATATDRPPHGFYDFNPWQEPVRAFPGDESLLTCPPRQRVSRAQDHPVQKTSPWTLLGEQYHPPGSSLSLLI